MTAWYSAPVGSHRLVLVLYHRAKALGYTMDSVAKRAGISRNTLKGWRDRHIPRLDRLEEALHAVGMELVAVPKGTVIPDNFLKITVDSRPE